MPGGPHLPVPDAEQAPQSPLGDVVWALRVPLPPALPSGTPILRLMAEANAVAGAAVVVAGWASVAPDGSLTGALLSEPAKTLTWGAGQANALRVVDVPLAAGAPGAGHLLRVEVTFRAAGWTLAQVSFWRACVVWV